MKKYQLKNQQNFKILKAFSVNNFLVSVLTIALVQSHKKTKF